MRLTPAVLFVSLSSLLSDRGTAQVAGAGEVTPIRVALRARNGGADRLTPLRYVGGFETKSLLFETLVRRAPDGRIVPGLASRWEVSPDGCTFRFELRRDAVFHDGRPVTAEAVRVHFQRWVGLPEHDWLAVNRRILGVQVESDRVFTVRLDAPYALLEDLVAINPCAIVGPGARDWEGEFQRPVGTGPFRFAQALDDGKRWRLEGIGADGPVLEVGFLPRGRDAAPIDALLRQQIDLFVGGWDEDLPAERLDELARDPRFVVRTAPGSSVVYLSFKLNEGPTRDAAVRRRIAHAVDRAALISEVEGGRAERCTAWAAPAMAFWPRPLKAAEVEPSPADAADGAPPIALQIGLGRGNGRSTRVAKAIQAQLVRAGFTVQVLEPPTGDGGAAPAAAGGNPAQPGTVRPLDAESGEVRAARNRANRALADRADVRVEITHGAPYCPHQSLVARFGPVASQNADAPRPRYGVDARLTELVAVAMSIPDEQQRLPLYRAIQELMDQETLIVPLYVPNRVALHTAAIEGVGLASDVYHVDLTGLRRVR